MPQANQFKASFIDTDLTTSFIDIWEATETRGHGDGDTGDTSADTMDQGERGS